MKAGKNEFAVKRPSPIQTTGASKRKLMQFHLIPGFLIFLGSYLPLAIILAMQDIPQSWWARPICTPDQITIGRCAFIPFENPALSLIFLGITTVSMILARASLKRLRYPYKVDVKSAKATPNEVINYTFPYVVSFMGIEYGEPQKLLGFGVFLLWMFAITQKSGQILMNPLLLIFGWRLYEATILINNIERDVRVLKQGPLQAGPQRAQTIQDFYILKD